MKDDEGKVWFGYPKPRTEYLQNHFPNYGVKFDLFDKVLRGMGYFCSDFKNKTIEGSDRPWLFTSGCVGLIRCEVPLIDDMWGEKPGVYTVRLGFSVASNDRVGQRVFDVQLQGDPVLKNLDILKEAGIVDKAVIKEFKGIEVENILTIELISTEMNPTVDQAPIINFIEVIREDVLESGEAVRPVSLVSRSKTETSLRKARLELRKNNYKNALEMYHAVFDTAPTVSQKSRALDGMAAVGSSESLGRIARYCRDIEPILWNYKKPDPKLKNSATKAFIAIANTIAGTDNQKAIKMLNHALKIANLENRKQVVASLKQLGIEIYGEKGEEF
jgi:hypothetical protein